MRTNSKVIWPYARPDLTQAYDRQHPVALPIQTPWTKERLNRAAKDAADRRFSFFAYLAEKRAERVAASLAERPAKPGRPAPVAYKVGDKTKAGATIKRILTTHGKELRIGPGHLVIFVVGCTKCGKDRECFKADLFQVKLCRPCRAEDAAKNQANFLKKVKS